MAEYWIADPLEHAVTQSILTDGKYIERPHEGVIAVFYLPGVTVDLAEVWYRELARSFSRNQHSFLASVSYAIEIL